MSLATLPARLRRSSRPLIPTLLLAPSVLMLAACTPSTPPPAAPQPTATRPAATRPAATAASQPAAKASPAPGASPAASPSPSPAPAASITILDATLADATPWVSLGLSDGEPVIVSGWRLEVGAQSIVVPGNAILHPGESLLLRAGDGESSEREVFLGPESHTLALAAAPGTRVRLIKTTGEVAAETTVPRF